MKAQSRPLRRHTVRLYLVASLLLLSACRDDALPVPPTAPDTEEEETYELPDAFHDSERTTPYPKADNELYLNPPPFIVPKNMKTDELLQFELSHDETFPEGETRQSEPKPWNIYGPHCKLETGTWYWRFRSVSTDGTPGEWSRNYSFEVKAETPIFVTPGFEIFRTNAPHSYPRLFCYLDPYIDEARRTVSSHREYKSLLSRARNAIEADYSAKNPNEDAEQLKVHIQSLYHAYHLTRQDEYAQRMHELLHCMLSYPVSDNLLFSANFTSTNIAVCYAMIYDLLHNELAADERLGAETIMMRMLRKLTPQMWGSQENKLTHNHFWQQNLRIYLQCAFLLYDHPSYSAEVLPMLEYYYELWVVRAPATGFNRDGAWHNGIGYFSANLTTLHYMPMLLSYITRQDFLQHPWYHNAARAMVYTWPPHSQNSGFGDSSEKKGDTPARQYAAFADFLARELGDPYAGWYASECDNELKDDIELRLYRICSPRTYDTELPADLTKMAWYRDIGEVNMHSCLSTTEKDVNLSFRSSTFGSGSHTTASQNAFNLLYQGKDIYRSSGYYYNYHSAHAIMSYRHSRAHNTLLVNGIGQTFSPKGYGNIMRAMGGAHITYCLGDASKAYNGITDEKAWLENFENIGIEQTPEYGFGTTPLTKYRRHVLMLHPEGTVLIYDELEASEAVTYDWLLHSPSQMFINRELLTVNSRNKETGATAVTQLFCNDPVTLSVTDQFYEPPIDPVAYPNQWHTTARIEGKAKTRVLAIIQVNPDGISPQIIRRTGNKLTVGNWTVEAQLDASQPVSLRVTNTAAPVCFDYGKENPILDGVPYPREYSMSSLLYDETDGGYEAVEMTDQLPISTRVAR